MSVLPKTPWPSVLSAVPVGGAAVVAIYGPILGGLIVNPFAAGDQGIGTVEELYVDLVTTAGLVATRTTVAIQPGGYFAIPATTGNVSINAATSGHKFSAVVFQPWANYQPPTGTFPPLAPTTLTKAIPATIYQEYNDDDDLQAFFKALNGLTQEDIDWFVETALPIYTGLSGSLLDYVVAGLYGLLRPALPTGTNYDEGPVNTWGANEIAVNAVIVVGNQNYYATTDDVFKRILTWHFFKADGKVFNVRWLKRRIMRFLIGTNGTAPPIDQTYRISITFVGRQVNINILAGAGALVAGTAIANGFAANSITPGAIKSTFTPFPALPLAPIFKAAVDSGVLELPFQYTYVVNV